MELFSVPVFRVTRAAPDIEYAVIKRGFDILCSLAGIVLLSPFMLFTALAIKLYDGGPVIYKQVRFTKDRREFNIYKFRSMRVDAERDGIARLASEHDDRITPVGKVIRACRFDELPQLFNILRGDMSVVGPRPERPEIAEQYEKLMPSFSLRLQVRAGLTGLAQVYGWTKYMCEQILRDLVKADPEWSVVNLRYFNSVGAHISGKIGEAPDGVPNNLMPFISQTAAGKRTYLNVFGNDYPTSDGTGIRDYIHVMDLAKGHVAAIHYGFCIKVFVIRILIICFQLHMYELISGSQHETKTAQNCQATDWMFLRCFRVLGGRKCKTL